MLSNLTALKIVSILTMCINSQRRFMGSSKPQEHGMNALEISLLLMASKSEKLTLLSSLKQLLKTCLSTKFMLTILYLGLLTSHLVKSLAGLWYRNLRCRWWEVEIFSWISNQATPRGHLHQPNKVHSRHTHQVWDEGCQAHQDTHGNQWASRPRHGR